MINFLSMSLISFSNVTKYYGTDLILDHISFNVNKGEKVALVGSNGNGKTTIFKLILKEEEPTLVAKEDKPGTISILNGSKIGYLNQDAISDINNTVEEEMMLSMRKIIAEVEYFNEFSKRLEYDKTEATLVKYNELLDRLNELDAFNLDHKVDEYLTKFGFDPSIKKTRVKNLSGGERMKIAFAKILLGDYDILLLDEPTNHLDISSIEWIEKFLSSYKGTILFISHDRYFLETVATKILDLENHKINTYNVNYNDYLNLKELNYQQQLAQFEHEEEEMARLKRFIEFYMPKPRFVGRAKDRVHKLEKLQENHIDAPKKENRNINFNIGGSNLKNKGLLEINSLLVGYNGKPLLPEISFSIYGKDRIAILGDNGIGKTTFIKTILGEIAPIGGTIRQLRPLKIGYIKQSDYIFDSNLDCLTFLSNNHKKMTERELRTALGRFLFKKEDVYKNCDKLSNGEKMRLVLCDLTLNEYDLLILDEPTNHLDMVTKECLLKALESYEGAILFISHDRYFVNSLARYIVYLSKDEVITLEGNYEDLKEYLDKNSEVLEGYSLETQKNNKSNVHNDLSNSIEKPKLSKNKLAEINNRIGEIENRLEELEKILSTEVDYLKINDYQNEKEKLEGEYFDLLEKMN